MKKQSLKLVLISVIFVIVTLFFIYQLPFYIYKPGSADPLNPVVEVEGGYESDGDMHLVTIQGMQATPFYYLLAKLKDYHQIVPIDEVFYDDMTEEEYRKIQLMMMENSQESSTVVAYEAANAEIDIRFEGVYVVDVLEGKPAFGVLEVGDKIVGIDGETIEEATDLTEYVQSKKVGDKIDIMIVRDEQQRTESIQLAKLESLNDKPGIGIQLVTNRDIEVQPELSFSSGDIGGPSAGLMFALEIYDQLTEEDLTHGLQIAGTGEIDYDGNVGRIGGIDKKVIAADNEGNDIFFAPYENGREDSNYEVAKKTAEEIGTDMKIIPVDHFNDALEYLQSL
ncbi:SepM family pheromone-processing serine protease [Gracilibacillus marinus]|jgi:Lon-like protease|uniref:endopeptidase La n=1 Tax=Gracilibacillus marinus TaxID=630535 RepID=A0ABV8VTF6_9BACI